MTDPVSWLQIGQGWRVLGADGVAVGRVAQVEGDKSADIFNGLAVESPRIGGIRYVPAEKVSGIYPGEVNLTLVASDLTTLELFREPPPVTTWRPGKPPLRIRIFNWLRRRP